MEHRFLTGEFTHDIVLLVPGVREDHPMGQPLAELSASFLDARTFEDAWTKAQSGDAIAEAIAHGNPELVERADFRRDWVDGDAVYVFLRRGVSQAQAEAAYCDLIAPAVSPPIVPVTVRLEAGKGAMVRRDDCSR